METLAVANSQESTDYSGSDALARHFPHPLWIGVRLVRQEEMTLQLGASQAIGSVEPRARSCVGLSGACRNRNEADTADVAQRPAQCAGARTGRLRSGTLPGDRFRRRETCSCFTARNHDSTKQPRGAGCPCAHTARREPIRQRHGGLRPPGSAGLFLPEAARRHHWRQSSCSATIPASHHGLPRACRSRAPKAFARKQS